MNVSGGEGAAMALWPASAEADSAAAPCNTRRRETKYWPRGDVILGAPRYLFDAQTLRTENDPDPQGRKSAPSEGWADLNLLCKSFFHFLIITSVKRPCVVYDVRRAS